MLQFGSSRPLGHLVQLCPQVFDFLLSLIQLDLHFLLPHERVAGHIDLVPDRLIHSFHNGGKDGIMQCKIPSPLLTALTVQRRDRQLAAAHIEDSR